jgi:hypothetical protein
LDYKFKEGTKMKADYLCPHCRGLLNAGDYIVFSSRTNKGGHGIIMLHPEVGNYTVAKHPMFEYEKGERLLFYCPMCNKELASDVHENLAKIILVDEEKKEFDIHFSRVAGEQSTFKIIGEHVEVFGEHSGNYLEFLGMK